MIIGPKRIDEAVQKAETAFWSELAKEFPEIVDADLDTGTVIVLFWQMKDAATRWLTMNMTAQEKEEPIDDKELARQIKEAHKKWYKPKEWLGER